MSPADGQRVVWRPLGPSSWRICDASFPRSHPAHLLAYVEQSPDGTFELTWVGPRVGTQRCTSADEVMRLATAELTLASSGTKPFPIPHRAPFDGRHAS